MCGLHKTSKMKQTKKPKLLQTLKITFLLTFVLVEFFGFGVFYKVSADSCAMTVAWGDQNQNVISSPPSSVAFPQSYSALITFQNCDGYSPSVIFKGPGYGSALGTTINLGAVITPTTKIRWATINLTQAGQYYFYGNAKDSSRTINSDIDSSNSSAITATAPVSVGSITTNPSNNGSVAFGGNITVSCSSLGSLPAGAGVAVDVNGATVQPLIPISNGQCSGTVAVNQTNNFNASGANSINLWVSDSSGNQIANTADVTESINTTNSLIYACPSTGSNPAWACDTQNSSTCANASGCAAGSTCTQVQVSQCGQSVSSSPAPTTPPAAAPPAAVPAAGGQSANSTTTLFNPIPGYSNLTALLVYIMKGFLGIVAVWAVAFIVIGGFRMVISSGNEEAVLAARKTITWAVLGLLIAVLSFAIIAIVQNLVGVSIPAGTTTTSQIKNQTKNS